MTREIPGFTKRAILKTVKTPIRMIRDNRRIFFPRLFSGVLRIRRAPKKLSRASARRTGIQRRSAAA